jgi:hypothetical protein
LLVDEDTIAALKIADRPLPAFQGHFNMTAADIFVFDTNIAVVATPDAKCVFKTEFPLLPWHPGDSHAQTRRGSSGAALTSGTHRRTSGSMR